MYSRIYVYSLVYKKVDSAGGLSLACGQQITGTSSKDKTAKDKSWVKETKTQTLTLYKPWNNCPLNTNSTPDLGIEHGDSCSVASDLITESRDRTNV